jgi:hypothetical protein
VFIIGGHNDKIKTKFKESLMSARDDYLQDAKDPSDPLDLHLIHDLLSSLKLMEITWSLEQRTKYGKNSAGIDVVIARHYQKDGYYFFLRQCVKLVDSITGNDQRVCCGVLCYQLGNSATQGQQNQILLTGAEYYVPNNLVENFKTGTVLFSFHQCVHFYYV